MEKTHQCNLANQLNTQQSVHIKKGIKKGILLSLPVYLHFDKQERLMQHLLHL
jgi:RNA binding exosome subunit